MADKRKIVHFTRQPATETAYEEMTVLYSDGAVYSKQPRKEWRQLALPDDEDKKTDTQD